ncbi:lectin like domain-containing protein [Clostridium oryzae]|uniref:Papain family cysteine protease n=1 Tax=Clostridium oryzae TaxID=1450648 RepID=A0A1V4IK44_9CLOT|nr:lectin like domain-containing protein [Clostridium oryzae]OPJ60200.1 papain family cysteine protease [Clostridium oryzae]
MKKTLKRKMLPLITVLVFLFETLVIPWNTVYAQKSRLNFKKEPLSNEFIKYTQNKKQNIVKSSNQTDDKHEKNYGHIISPSNNTHYFPKEGHKFTFSKAEGLPAKYDLRKLKRITPIRDQGTLGTCWAFAAYGSLESTLLPKEKQDFSENNLINKSGFDNNYNDGGYPGMAIAYLSRWNGPVSEKEDKYTGKIKRSPSNLQPQKHIQNADYITGNDIDSLYANIKKAIITSGAIDTGMYMNEDKYYDDEHYSYYCDHKKKKYYINHEVDIVGWDDNFSRNKFESPSGKKPSHNGAFIVRNSWGKDWGDNGYFYISYEDVYAFTENVAFNDAEDTDNYTSEYSYDPLGVTDWYGYEEDTAYAANVFTATSNSVISAVAFYTKTQDTSYEIKIYNNVNGNSFTDLKLTKSGTIEYGGYHTIKLDTGVQLEKNKEFAVSIKFTSPGSKYPLPIEDPIDGYSSRATANPDESYISDDGIVWYDLTKEDECKNTNVCIKAFTSDSTNAENTFKKTKR